MTDTSRNDGLRGNEHAKFNMDFVWNRFEPNQNARIGIFLILFSALLLSVSGCTPEEKTSTPGSESNPDQATGGLLGEGDEVFMDNRSNRYEQQFSGRPSGASGESGYGDSNRWSLVLATVTGPSHQLQAQSICQDMKREFPQLQGAFVKSNNRGSTVWIGRFPGPKDPALLQTRKQLSALNRNGQPVFRSMISSVLPDERAIGKMDLRQARLMYPKVNPLYTLQVACWGTFGGNQISWTEVQRKAEDYASVLRRQGHEAWYHHDDVSKLSVVTVGVFDRRAYNAQSTLFSPEVEMLRREFPQHMINGEKAMIEMQPGDSSSQVPQACRLVAVPELP